MSESGPGELINGDQGIKSNTVVVTDLLPDTKYFAQVAVAGARARTDGEPGYYKNSYSPVLEFTTITDNVAPAAPVITHAGFDEEGTFRVEWETVTENEDGSSLASTKDFRDYTVTFFPTSAPEDIREYSTTDKKFELPLPLNRLLFTSPVTDLTVEVRARDLAYNESDPATGQDAIDDLAAPLWDEGAASGPLSVRLSWLPVDGASYYEVWRGTTLNFSIADGTFVSSHSQAGDESVTFYTIPPDSAVYHYRIIARGLFGQASPASSSRSAAAESPIEPAEDIDYVLAAPSISVDTDKGHQFVLTHTLTDTASGDVQPGFLVVYAGTTGTEERLGTIPVPRSESGDVPASVSGTFTYVVANDTTAIRATVVPANTAAVEFEGGRSAVSNQVTIPQAGATYIADAAITDAKIQNLSASKLVANTAIVGDLFVESQLTVRDGGLIRTDNFGTNTGWAISYTGYAELNDVKVRGTVEATAGFLQNLNVRGTITVGDGATSGSIRSTAGITASNGWSINSNGSLQANNISARGYIDATSGFLGSLTVTGNIVVGQSTGGGQIQSYTQTSTNGWSISRTGFAAFNNIQARGYIDAESGYLRNLTVLGTIIVGSGGSGGTMRSSNYSSISGGWQLLSSGSFTAYNGNLYLNGTSGARIRIYSSGIFGWNSSSSQTFAISSVSGNAVFYDGTFMGNLSSATFSSGLVTASTVQTRSSGSRVVMSSNSDSVTFYNSSNVWSRISQGNLDGLETSGSLRLGGSNAVGTLYSAQTTYVHSTRNWRWRVSGDTFYLDQSTTSTVNMLSSFVYRWGTTAWFACTSDGNGRLGTSTMRWRDVWATDLTINSSDEGMKEGMDESPALGMNLVEKLPAMSFKWKDGYRRHYGWSAQSLRNKLTELGVSTDDFAGFIDPSVNPENPEEYEARVAEGNPPGLAIRSGELTAVLWEAVRELNQRVKELEAAAAV